MKLRTNFRGI